MTSSCLHNVTDHRYRDAGRPSPRRAGCCKCPSL